MEEHSREEANRDLKCPLNFCRRAKYNGMWKVLKALNLMVYMLFFGFSMSFQFGYRDNLIYKQLCKERLPDYFKFCYEIKSSNVTDNRSLEVFEIVNSSHSHVFSMIGLKIFIACFSACLLCSWSDSYGRKFPLLVALIGENFDMLSYFVRDFSYLYFIWLIYLFTAVSGLFGSYICIFTMSYCYLTDRYSSKYRALMFAMIDFTYVLGTIGGVVVFKNLIRVDTLFESFLTIFVVRLVLIIWILLTFRDKHFELKPDKLFKKLKNLFSTRHVKETFMAIRKKRPNCQAEQLFLIMFSAIPVMIAYSLIEGVIYSTTFHARLFDKYSDYEEITLYFAIYTCFAAPIFIAIYHYLSKYKDSTLGMIGFFNLYLSSFTSAFSMDYLTFVVGLGIAPLKGFTVVALRSSYSKIADENERGKLFFLYATSEVSAMFFGYLLYYKLRLILTPKDDILPYMVLSTAMILSLCTFTFQVISIQTEHLFGMCYRTVPGTNVQRCN